MTHLTITPQDIRYLIAGPSDTPVLYVKHGPDNEGGAPELDVWDESLVPHHSIVVHRRDLVDVFGPDQDLNTLTDDELQELIEQGSYQDCVDQVLTA